MREKIDFQDDQPPSIFLKREISLFEKVEGWSSWKLQKSPHFYQGGKAPVKGQADLRCLALNYAERGVIF